MILINKKFDFNINALLTNVNKSLFNLLSEDLNLGITSGLKIISFFLYKFKILKN